MPNWTLSQTFDFHGQPIRYDVAGAGPPLVLVHGTPWSSFNWRHLIPRLSQRWTVYYFDLLGYGQSAKQDGQRVALDVQNELLTALLLHWQLDAPRIIGHDFGGTTVLRTHLINKVPFKQIVLVDPVALAPWGSSFFAHVRAHEAAFAGVPDYIHEAIVAAYVKGAMHTEMSDETLAGILRPWMGDFGRKAFYRQIAQADQKYTDEIEPLYPTITRPTLIAWGESDEWIPLTVGQRLHALIPDSQFSPIANAGHLVQEDQPGALLATIENFLC